MIPKKAFMNNLKKVRCLLGLDQHQISALLCIERTRYACWETGKSEPNLNMLVEISNVLHTPIDDLLTKEL